MATTEQNTERISVRTYVPAYQRDRWDEHAEDLDMSRSEFVRSMVQAGRRGFDPRGSTPETGEDGNSEKSDDNDGAGSPLETEILDQLAGECLSWDELFEAVTDDIESQLEETLQELQAENRVQYSGPKGGYVLVE
jgi:hypothetical protein